MSSSVDLSLIESPRPIGELRDALSKSREDKTCKIFGIGPGKRGSSIVFYIIDNGQLVICTRRAAGRGDSIILQVIEVEINISTV